MTFLSEKQKQKTKQKTKQKSNGKRCVLRLSEHCFSIVCVRITQNWIRFNWNFAYYHYSGEFQNRLTIPLVGLRRQICRGLRSAFRICISIVLVGVVNQQKLAGAFLISATNFSLAYINISKEV